MITRWQGPGKLEPSHIAAGGDSLVISHKVTTVTLYGQTTSPIGIQPEKENDIPT